MSKSKSNPRQRPVWLLGLNFGLVMHYVMDITLAVHSMSFIRSGRLRLNVIAEFSGRNRSKIEQFFHRSPEDCGVFGAEQGRQREGL